MMKQGDKKVSSLAETSQHHHQSIQGKTLTQIHVIPVRETEL